MYKITLEGPTNEFTAKTDNRELFKRFLIWLRDYDYLKEKVTDDRYRLDSDNRIKACQVKARRLGLIA